MVCTSYAVNNFEKEVFIISILIAPVSILLYVIISTGIITNILKNKVEKKTVNLISSIGMLPTMPVLWLMSNNLKPSADIFIYLYVPLVTTIFVVSILVIRIIKFKQD